MASHATPCLHNHVRQFLLYIYIYMFLKYLFWLRWVFCCCVQAFSSCGVRASHCSVRASHCGGFSYCGAQALELKFGSCGTWLSAPKYVESYRSGLEAMSPALVGGFLTNDYQQSPILCTLKYIYLFICMYL